MLSDTLLLLQLKCPIEGQECIIINNNNAQKNYIVLNQNILLTGCEWSPLVVCHVPFFLLFLGEVGLK